MSGRKRFTLSDDIALVKEVLYVNPFLDPARWLKIADRLSEVLGRCFSIRSVRERLNLILLRFSRDQKKKIKREWTTTQNAHSTKKEIGPLLLRSFNNCKVFPAVYWKGRTPCVPDAPLRYYYSNSLWSKKQTTPPPSAKVKSRWSLQRGLAGQRIIEEGLDSGVGPNTTADHARRPWLSE
ncbi:hypothetical protein MRX96_014895 [Rhipicephalus microplus]